MRLPPDPTAEAGTDAAVVGMSGLVCLYSVGIQARRYMTNS